MKTLSVRSFTFRWPMKRCRLVSVVKLTTFLAPCEHVLITRCLSFQFSVEAYSIFKVCMCQYGDANSTSNWRRVFL